MKNRLVPIVLLVLAAILLIPPNSPGSSVFYISAMFFIIALFVPARGKGFNYALSYIGLRPKKQKILFLFAIGITALVLSVIITALVSLVLYQLGFLDTGPVRDKIFSLPLVALIGAFTVAPLGEEALFRGLIFRKASEISKSWVIGALVSSAIFAAMHFSYGSVAEIAVAFSIGLVFCAFVKKTKSLIPSLVAHASFNFLSIIFVVFI